MLNKGSFLRDPFLYLQPVPVLTHGGLGESVSSYTPSGEGGSR